MQDQDVQESQEPVVDRIQEHLGSRDTAIIQVRKRLLDAARRLRAGVPRRASTQRCTACAPRR
jgi:hypothetical protein